MSSYIGILKEAAKFITDIAVSKYQFLEGMAHFLNLQLVFSRQH